MEKAKINIKTPSMQIEDKKSIAAIYSDSIENLKHDLKNTRECSEILVLILCFSNECEFAENNEFDGQLIKQIRSFPIPIITLIKDVARGFVFEILLASHLCIASESALFEIKNIENLKKHIGSKNIRKSEFIKNPINAEKALDLGFINKSVPYEDVKKEAFEMAEKIAALAPLAIRSCLEAVNKGLEMNLEKGLELETELFAKIFETEDMKEGTRAFFEKRKANFQGK